MRAFVVPGKPQGKARARTVTQGGHVHSYTPSRTMEAERTIAWAYREQCHGPLMEGPLSLSVLAVFEPPKSWPKKRREAAMETPHTQKPDWDNVGKLVSDSLEGVAYMNDSQIAGGSVRKVWGSPTRMDVTLEEMR